jgi:hypothetical protein
MYRRRGSIAIPWRYLVRATTVACRPEPVATEGNAYPPVLERAGRIIDGLRVRPPLHPSPMSVASLKSRSVVSLARTQPFACLRQAAKTICDRKKLAAQAPKLAAKRPTGCQKFLLIPQQRLGLPVSARFSNLVVISHRLRPNHIGKLPYNRCCSANTSAKMLFFDGTALSEACSHQA